MWEEHRSSLVGHMNEDVFNALVGAYVTLQNDRTRFLVASKLPADTPLPPKEAQGLKELADQMERLRRLLGGGDAAL